MKKSIFTINNFSKKYNHKNFYKYLLINNKKNFSSKLFFGDDIDKIDVTKQNMDILEEKKILREGNK